MFKMEFPQFLDKKFSFGKNWKKFIKKNFSEERMVNAKKRLQEVLRLDNFKGYTFLDIGCGSGLHSLAALQCGASRVVSFDCDREAVEITKYLRSLEGNPDHWDVIQGSVLDDVFMRSLPQADIIYAYGVLHHTGDTWQALKNSLIPLSPNGVFYVALYSRTNYFNAHLACGDPTPEKWLEIKKQYNRAGILKKKAMELRYVLQTFLWKDLHHFLSDIMHLSTTIKRILNFQRHVFEYKRYRGMEFWTDVRDWLGGWPMDFIEESEMLQFAESNLRLELLDMTTGEGNTEYIFRPIGASNYWDDLLEKYTIEEIPRPFSHNEGYCWVAPLNHLYDLADNDEMSNRSNLRLLEDNKQLSFAHAPHITIQKVGKGRYRHWGDTLYFSSSDNSNPNNNGRSYTIRYLR